MDIWDQLLTSSQTDSRFYGLTVGKVTDNVDEDGLGRVKLIFPWLSSKDGSHWARVVTPMAGKDRGFFFLPEVGDEVLVAFEHGMMEFPYVLGALWNGVDKPPEKKDKKTNKRTIKSTSGHIIRLDDTKGEEKIEVIDMSGENSIIIDSKANTVTISAKKEIIIQSSDGKLILKGKGVEIDSTDEIKITTSKKMSLKAGSELKIKGQMVKIN
ncbi:VgrG protein [hydrothermal vent metagenome]|uniref:VgrG protein n=1 Tax=hydrothermal vent metagenome TaxID=652676 RepID=A0A3B0W894_9ZZZZ